jgi:hypothetical protein
MTADTDMRSPAGSVDLIDIARCGQSPRKERA